MAAIKIQTSTRRILDFAENRLVFPIPPYTELGESVVIVDTLPTGIAVGMVLSQDGTSVSAYAEPAESLADELTRLITVFVDAYMEGDRDFQPVLVWERTDGALLSATGGLSLTWPEVIIRSWWKPHTRYVIERIRIAQADTTAANVAAVETALNLYLAEFSPSNGGLGMDVWYHAANRQVWVAFANPGTVVYSTDATTGGFAATVGSVNYGPDNVITWGMRADVLSINP